jgi:hypothetical protein
MKYDEFRVVILNEEDIRATLPDGRVRKGKVQWDAQTKRTIEWFHTMLAAGNIREREGIEVFGSLLYSVLFNHLGSDDLSAEFKSTFEGMKNKDETYLRLVLEFETGVRELATYPWEYLYYPDTYNEKGFQIATRSKLILTRHVPLSVDQKILAPCEKPLRILIAVSQPKDTQTINADQVIQSIEKLREASPDAIEIDRLYQPDGRSFSKKLKEFRPHVLHFIGHGDWDREKKIGRVSFVNPGSETAAWLSDKDFSDYFQDFQPRLIFLDACQGATTETYRGFRGVALQLVYSKVPAVIAMQYPIKDEAAVQFANKFYECLGEGEPIDVAVQEGRNELGMYLQDAHFSSRDFGSPVAFLQAADGIVVAKREEVIPKEEVIRKVSCPNPDCDGLVRDFDNTCLKCGHPLGKCPSGHIIDKKIGKCAICQWSERESMAVPLKKGERVKKTEPSPAYEPGKPKAQPRQ